LSHGFTARAAQARGRVVPSVGGLLAALLAALALLAGCGQRGPLTLPDSARPIDRLDPASGAPTQPDAASPTGVAQPAPGAATGTTAPAQREPGGEDTTKNKARRTENER
jgi:predicted small lipoprotein YifL